MSETPAGEAGSGRPHRRECVEEAPGPPAESEDMRYNQQRRRLYTKKKGAKAKDFYTKASGVGSFGSVS